MILKIIDKNGKEHGIKIYENNFDGELETQDTFYIQELEYGFDDIFGTNDKMITIKLTEEL